MLCLQELQTEDLIMMISLMTMIERKRNFRGQNPNMKKSPTSTVTSSYNSICITLAKYCTARLQPRPDCMCIRGM